MSEFGTPFTCSFYLNFVWRTSCDYLDFIAIFLSVRLSVCLFACMIFTFFVYLSAPLFPYFNAFAHVNSLSLLKKRMWDYNVGPWIQHNLRMTIRFNDYQWLSLFELQDDDVPEFAAGADAREGRRADQHAGQAPHFCNHRMGVGKILEVTYLKLRWKSTKIKN